MYTPSRRVFREFAATGKRVPVAACLALEAAAEELFQAVGFSPPCILLESARPHPATGRYSLIVGEPRFLLTAKGEWTTLQSGAGRQSFSRNPLDLLQELLEANRAVRLPGFPPFAGGAVGFFGFDAYRYVESLPSSAQDDLKLPDLSFLFCDEALVVDHLLKKLWVIALADADGDPDRAYDGAVARIDALLRRATRFPEGERCGVKDQGKDFSTPAAVHSSPVSCTHTRAGFEAMVRKAKGFIADGEIYQANLSQRFSVPLAAEPWEMYCRLKAINPSPFAAYADLGFLRIVSASPERFLRVKDQRIETRPIAGTRPKGGNAVETARMRQELILNEKERAEHLMLVDLERNDLGRVCRYGSVRVDELMVLEEYSHVIHIVSNVRGLLRPDIRPIDLIAAAFPGGTITGCPKIRCLEIIDSLEPVRRQLYTGSLGYISYTGEMDLNLLIRSAFVTGGAVHIQAGAGIVADSDPAREYEETVHKARALMEALHAEIPAADGLVAAAV